jgi:hypothetical protein
MTTIFDALRTSQREIDDLLADVFHAISTGQLVFAKRLFHLMSVKVIAATGAEHAVVYPRFAHDAHLVDEVAQALREHDGIIRMIDLLRVGGLDSDDWCEGVRQLGRLIADHTDCEELDLFPMASLSLPTEVLHEIAREFVDHVRMVVPVAGASITYEVPEPELPRPVIVHVRAA